MNAVLKSAGIRFETRSDGTVIDHSTGLMWSAEDVGADRLTWQEADQTARAVTLGGHDDWRLPTRTELLSLVDDTRFNPAIDTEAFPTCKSDWYWTASPWAPSPASYAWIVNFYNGHSLGSHRYCGARVRAVRSVSPASARCDEAEAA